MNPINDAPTIAMHRPRTAMESFSKNRRRLISSGVSVSGADDDSVSFVSMANLRDPTGKRCDEEDNTDQPNDPDGDQSPEKKGDSQGKPSWEVGRVGQRRIG